MRNSKTFQYFISATSIALILSLLLTATVVADDTPPPTEEPVSSEEESLLVSEDPLSLPEIPEELPEEIPIIVLVDEQIEPLATQQALNAFVIGDPIWCPVGIPPNPGAGGCTATYANLTLLITAIENSDIPEPAADGVIWITDGIDTSPSTVIIDGSPFGFSTWTNFQLTLQGGWDGSPAGTIIGSTTFSVPLWILDWGAPVTINNINVNGTGSTGLYVESSGDVSLDGVSVSGNTGAGLFVDAGANINAQNLSAANNDTGASLFAGNDISLTGANQFDNNTNSGLYADAGGDINAENLSAVGNGLGGVSLNAVGNISVAGTNIFNSNSGGIGLYADAGGNIAAENLSAEGNNTGSLLLSGGDILLTGSSEFNNNTTSGLYADAGAGINAENLNATGNGTDGVILNAVGSIALAGTNVFNANAGGIGLYVDAGGDITAENLSAADNNSGSLLLSGGDISLTGTSEFNNNTTSGLYADAGGDINAENLGAVGNGLDGVSLNAVGNISLTGVNIFNANAGGIGLYADAGGDIAAENLSAEDNNAGSLLLSGGDISLTGASGFNNNTTSGLYADAGTGITAENLSAVGNGLDGVSLNAVGNISLAGTNIFNANAGGYGLYVDAGGNIDAENLTANDNQLSGANLIAGGSISATGTNVLNNNNGSGLEADAGGDIDVENVTADGNGFSGANLTSGGDVSVTGSNAMNTNAGYGLFVDAGGDIDVESISAGGNGLSGAELISLGNVSLIGANVFDGNSGSGLYVDAAGSISAENLTASNNGETGATLVAVGNVELTGTNVFDNNALSGLFVDTGGNIGLENISAEGNSGYGAELIGSGGDVSIMGTNIFNGNAFSGLYAEGVNIYAENLTANGNGILAGFGNGADLYSLNTFILAGVNTFSGNNNSGLFVDAGGNIDAENITAIGNGAGGVLGHGAEFYSLNGAFNLTGSSAFNGNYSNGLVVDVNSDIYIFHANAMSNGGHGMYLGTDGDAHVTCGLILNNGLRAINTGITGRLILYGVNFGGNPNLFIGIDPFQLRLISNSCFTYPGTYIPNEEVPDELRIRYVYNVDGKDIGLDCEYYDGTQLYLSNGDGAYVPCPIIDNVRLDRVLETDLADAPPLPDKYVSGMNVRVTWEGEKFFEPIDSTDVVWFVNPGSFAGYEAARWDGRQWVDITNEIPPFITVFFRIPPEMRNTNFSIMYWDDTEWIELTSRTHLGEGQIVRVTGRSAFSPDFGETNPNGIYYIAEVNFIGRFVLVEK